MANLKQTENKVVIEGLVAENNLEIVAAKRKIDGKDVDDRKVQGTLEIRTGEDETQTVKVFMWEKKKDGNPNKKFAGFETLANELKSIADVGQAEASKVKITDGELTLNEYYGQDGKFKQFPQVTAGYSGFVNRVEEGKPFELRAEFTDLEIIVSKVVEEFTRGEDAEPTGRVIVEGYTVNHAGVVSPQKFVVEEGGGAEYVMDNFEKGKLATVYGKLVNIQKEHIKFEEMGFGKPKEVKTYEYVREQVITGGSIYDTDVKEDKKIDLEVLKSALQQRELHLASLKSDNENKDNNGGAKPPVKGSSNPSVDIGGLF